MEVISIAGADISLVKIGKLATPAVLVLVGAYFLAIGAYVPGILLIAFGALIYIVVWLLVRQTVVFIANAELRKERLKLKREKLRKEREQIRGERAARMPMMLAEKHRLERETIDKKFANSLAKKIIDAL